MNHTQHHQEQQEAKRLHSRISSFLQDFKVGTLLSGSDIRKLRGAKPLAVFTTIFSLPFSGVNFARGIVNNLELDFRKDTAHEFLKNPRYNWRTFLLNLVTVAVRFMDMLTSEQREKALIIDDSTYDRSRSKMVELLAWVHDHNANRSLKGFKLMTLGWSDGVSLLPLDFILCSSSKTSKRLQGIRKEVDKRCCGYRRRLEAMAKSTEHQETMVKRVLARGIRADYLLMDSWFSFPALVPLITAGGEAGRMAGLQLRNIGVRLFIGGKKRGEAFGELAFLDFGLSGPVILTLSGRIVEALHVGEGVELALDLKPALDEGKLDARLLRDLNARHAEPIASVLRGLLPQEMIAVALERTGLAAERAAGTIRAEERKRLRLWLKDFRLRIVAHRPLAEAIVTAGGVDTREIDPRTMGSRLVRGLFVAGELLDIQADTGGYNLQAAFSTGWLAGRAAAGSLATEA